MTGSMIVNNLAGLMMLTSLFVISVKSYRLSCGFYACQSLVLVSIFATLSCLFAAEQPMATGLKPALAVALGHFLLGLLCIVSQRNILRQIFGYCLMENGSHLVLALLAWRAPELVEIGIATDAIFAVIVMVLLARKIWRTHGTLDVNNLTALKG